MGSRYRPTSMSKSDEERDHSLKYELPSSGTHSDSLSLHLSLSDRVKYSKNTPTCTTYKDAHCRKSFVNLMEVVISWHE